MVRLLNVPTPLTEVPYSQHSIYNLTKNDINAIDKQQQLQQQQQQQQQFNVSVDDKNCDATFVTVVEVNNVNFVINSDDDDDDENWSVSGQPNDFSALTDELKNNKGESDKTYFEVSQEIQPLVKFLKKTTKTTTLTPTPTTTTTTTTTTTATKNIEKSTINEKETIFTNNDTGEEFNVEELLKEGLGDSGDYNIDISDCQNIYVPEAAMNVQEYDSSPCTIAAVKSIIEPNKNDNNSLMMLSTFQNNQTYNVSDNYVAMVTATTKPSLFDPSSANETALVMLAQQPQQQSLVYSTTATNQPQQQLQSVNQNQYYTDVNNIKEQLMQSLNMTGTEFTEQQQQQQQQQHQQHHHGNEKVSAQEENRFVGCVDASSSPTTSSAANSLPLGHEHSGGSSYKMDGVTDHVETESPQITQKKFWKKDILKHTDEKQQTTIIDANTNEERENDSADEDSSSSSKSTASFRSIDSDSSNSDSSDETYKPQVPVKKKKSAKKIKSAEETDTDMEDETQKKPKKIVPKSCYVRLTKNKQVSKATNETTTAATAATITTTDKYTNALHCTMIDKYTADIKSVLRLSNFYESLYNRHVQFLSHDNPTVSQCESMAKILQSERCRVEQINMLTESLIKVLQNYMVFEIAQKRIQGKEKVITIVEKMQKQLPGIGNTSLDGTIYTSLRNLIRQLNEKTSRNIVVLRSKERTDFDLMQLQSIKRPTVAPTRKFLEIYVQVVLRCVLKFKNDQIYLPLTKQLDRSWRRLSSSPLKYPKRFTGTLKPVKFWSEEYKRFYYLHKYLKCLNTKFSIYINHCDVMISKLKKETNTTTDETAADKRRDLSSSSTVDWPEQLSQPQHNTKNGFSLLGSKYWKKITSSTEPYEFMLETQEEYEQQTQQCIDSPNPSPENPLLLEDTIQTISKNNVPLPDQLRSAPSNSGCNSGNLVAVPPRSASSSSSSSLSQPAQIQILKRKNTDVQQQQQKKKRTNSIGEKLKLRLAMANLLLNKNTEENTIASQKRTNDKYTPLERTVLRSFFFEQDEQNQESFLRMVNNIEFVFYDLERFYLQQKILTTTETPSLFNDVISLLENQLAVFNLLNETELHPVVDTGKRNDEYTLLEQKMLKKYFIQLNAAEQENLLCRTTSVSFLFNTLETMCQSQNETTTEAMDATEDCDQF